MKITLLQRYGQETHRMMGLLPYPGGKYVLSEVSFSENKRTYTT